MRITPKKTKISMEFFKGIEIPGVLVGTAGITIVVSVLFSNLPHRMEIALGIVVLFGTSIIPIDGNEGYRLVYNVLRYRTRYRVFKEEPAEKEEMAIKNVTPFTGIDDSFVEYGGEYYGIVVNIPDIEFKFYTEVGRNQMIDHAFGSVLHTIPGSESAFLTRIGRPVLYDSYLAVEDRKLAELREAYINGLLNEEELTARAGIAQDRKEQIRFLNDRDKVYAPFYYLTLSRKGREVLLSQAQNMVNTISVDNWNCKTLSEKELVVFLRHSYTLFFDEREVYQLTRDQYMDWILPKRVRINSHTVQYDNIMTHNSRVTDYLTSVGNAQGANLFSRLDTKVVMETQMIDQYKGIRQIDRVIDELREQSNSTGKTSKLMGLQTHVDIPIEVLAMLQGNNEVLLDVNIFVTAYNYELSEQLVKPGKKKATNSIASMKKQIKRSLSGENFKSPDSCMQQSEVYVPTQVSGCDTYKHYSRSIHSTSAAAVFPFVNKSICDPSGICTGKNRGRPVFIDFFVKDRERTNDNMVVIGKLGSSKSYTTKMILADLAADNSKVFILGPKNEYYGLAKNMSGKIIDVGSTTQGRLGPFHIVTSLFDDEEETDTTNTSFPTRLQLLEEFHRQILPGIELGTLKYLNNIAVHMCDAKGIDTGTDLSKLSAKDYPIFDDLYDKILDNYRMSSDEYGKEDLRVLSNYISKFATGGRNSLLQGGPSSISTDENFIMFNFQSLLANKGNAIMNTQMLLVLEWPNNEVIGNRDYNIRYDASGKIIVIIDEVHVFIDSKFPIALDFMYQLAKRIRKYSGVQIVITQNVTDFVGTEELARKSSAVINVCQYPFILPLTPNDIYGLCKLYERAGVINESEQEEIVSNGHGHAFMVTSPSNCTGIEVMTSKDVEQLFTVQAERSRKRIKKNHRWRFLVTLLAAGVILIIGGCSGKKSDRVSQIKGSGTFRVVVVNTNNRYAGFRRETPVGIEPELCDMITQALGVTTEYQAMSRNQVLQIVNEGQADIAVGYISATGRLDDEYQISTPYGKGFFYTVTKADDYAMTVGALEDSPVNVDLGIDEETRTQLYQAKGIPVQDYENLQDAAADIKNGATRAYICYKMQAKEPALDSELQVQGLMNLDAEKFVVVAGKEGQTPISGINIIARQLLGKEN